MLLNGEMTISEIVQVDYRTSDVFKKYNVNFCCSGRISLQDACVQRGLDMTSVMSDLTEITRTVFISPQIDYYSWKIDFLIDYIINIHHGYLKVALPALELRIISFADGHTKKYPELSDILKAFMEILPMLLSQNQYEEEVIFPYIKQIEKAYNGKESYANLLVKTMRKPLNSLSNDNARLTGLLEQLKHVTKNFTFPPKACTNHQVLYHKLKEFYNDMLQHKHLENNILLPGALHIEKESLLL